MNSEPKYESMAGEGRVIHLVPAGEGLVHSLDFGCPCAPNADRDWEGRPFAIHQEMWF